MNKKKNNEVDDFFEDTGGTPYTMTRGEKSLDVIIIDIPRGSIGSLSSLKGEEMTDEEAMESLATMDELIYECVREADDINKYVFKSPKDVELKFPLRYTRDYEDLLNAVMHANDLGEALNLAMQEEELDAHPLDEK